MRRRCNRACRRRLSRRRKNILHGLLLVGIVCSLGLEGGQLADWLFVALGVAVEVS